jgi:hypothetical protein
MQIIPHSKQDWLRLLVFPFKAYVIIAPLLFLISIQFPRPRISGATNSEVFYLVSLLPCSLILLLSGLISSFAGRKHFAFSCFGFSLAALVVAVVFLPRLSNT